MSTTRIIEEARRQIEICNACRYCEGYCSVFPAINRERNFGDSDVIQLANLCHNCRGCYYACQYTEPHEFSLNVPKVLAEVRQNSWQDHTVPAKFAKAFHKSGIAISVATIAGLSLLLWIIKAFGGAGGNGFYSVLSHNTLVSIFSIAFILPLLTIFFSIRAYWRSIEGQPLTLAHVSEALNSTAQMKNLSGGHGDGCNFEDEDRFSNQRRWMHQAVMYGFLLCFAATSAATIMHYVFSLPAPYSFFSLPKLLGVTGGILLSLGTLGMARIKLKADRDLADNTVWGGEMAFIGLLFMVSSTGLLLYWMADSNWLAEILALHLGTVLTFFLLAPYSKMVHGFYRLASLLKDAQAHT